MFKGINKKLDKLIQDGEALSKGLESLEAKIGLLLDNSTVPTKGLLVSEKEPSALNRRGCLISGTTKYNNVSEVREQIYKKMGTAGSINSFRIIEINFDTCQVLYNDVNDNIENIHIPRHEKRLTSLFSATFGGNWFLKKVMI